MKKLLLLGALAITGFVANAADESYLDRTGWTVTACSSIDEGGGSGPASAMIDDNLSTYFHQSWASDTGRGTHWFIIDMGSEQEFHGLDIWGRQNHINGHIEEAKIYASNTPFEQFASHDAAKEYYDNNENKPVGYVFYEYNQATRNDVQKSRFFPVTARYILVVTNKTSENHLCIAEVEAVGGSVAFDNVVDLDRTDWVATVCSEAREYEGDAGGYATNMFDDDLSTYYHQNWLTDNSAEAYHWMIIDLGESETIDGFKYWRRQGNGNGQFLEGNVYVSDTKFEEFTDNNAAMSYYHNAANNPVGNFTFSYNSNANDVRICNFDRTATGRYVMVILSESGKSQGGRHMCCAEFKLFKGGVANREIWKSSINVGAYNVAHNFALLREATPNTPFPSMSVPEDLTAENYAEKVEAMNDGLANYPSTFNKAQIVIRNPYRRSGKPYMAAIPLGNGVKFNTTTLGNPDAVWELRIKNNMIQLLNRNTGLYIGSSQNAVLEAGAQSYVPRRINNNYVAFSKAGRSTLSLLNVDGGANDLTEWGSASDQGSSWSVAPASKDNCIYALPEASNDSNVKYYRIVNARWMYNGEAPCMAVNGENQIGSGNGETNARGYATFPGIYWRVDSVSEGDGVKLTNLTGYELTYSGQNLTTLTDNGSTFYLVQQTDAQFNQYNVYAISSVSEPTNTSCIDVSGDGTKVCWNPVRDKSGNGNNGSAWYFILATDEEIATATETYINNVASRVTVDPELDNIFGEGFAASISPEFEHTVASVNDVKKGGGITAIQDAVNAKVPALVGHHYLLHNKNTNYSNCYMTLTTDSVGNSTTAPTANAADVNALWSFIPSGEGYMVTSEATGKALTYINAQSEPIPAAEVGLPYSIAYNQNVKGFYITLIPCAENEGQNRNYYSLHQGNNDLVCKWAAGDIPGSHWMLEPAAAIVMEVALGEEDGVHEVVLPEGAEFNTHESAANHVITITPQVAEEISLFAIAPDENGVHTIAASDFTDGKAQISGLQEGNYVMSVPAGMFVVNGKPSAAHSLLFAVNNDGSTTGIDEVAPAAAEMVVYDLQGRRVNGNAKGLLIVNGRKVFVK